MLGQLIGCTGIDPIDNLLAPPKDYYQNILFDNQGQFPIVVHGFFGQHVDDNRCSPDSIFTDDKASPGHRVSMSFKVTCKLSAHGHASVDLLQGTQTGSVYFSRADLVAKLIPGLTVLIMDATGAVQIRVPVVRSSGSGVPSGAWVALSTSYDNPDSWSLNVPIPVQLLDRAYRSGFPLLGILSWVGSGPPSKRILCFGFTGSRRNYIQPRVDFRSGARDLLRCELQIDQLLMKRLN